MSQYMWACLLGDRAEVSERWVFDLDFCLTRMLPPVAFVASLPTIGVIMPHVQGNFGRVLNDGSTWASGYVACALSSTGSTWGST